MLLAPITEHSRFTELVPLPFVLHELALALLFALHRIGQLPLGDPGGPAEQNEVPIYPSTEQAPADEDWLTEHWFEAGPALVEQKLL